MAQVQIWVSGVNASQTALIIEAERITAKSLAKITALGKSVQATAKQNLAKHKDSGATIAAVKVSAPSIISKYMDSSALEMFSEEMARPSWMKQMRDPSTGRFMSFNPLQVVVPKLITITVGIEHTNVPPFFVGSTFEHGWESDTGKRPPTEPLAEWAMRRGIADQKSAKGVGFMIAKRIGERGYSFGTNTWLSDAWVTHQASASAIASGGFLR